MSTKEKDYEDGGVERNTCCRDVSTKRKCKNLIFDNNNKISPEQHRHEHRHELVVMNYYRCIIMNKYSCIEASAIELETRKIEDSRLAK